MATEAVVNGTSSAEDGKTAAQKLMEKHALIEDVIDEEDILHPPPSLTVQAPDNTATSQSTGSGLSEKAAGKQRAPEVPEASVPKKSSHMPLNTQSEEMFPALGAPKARSPVSVSWGKKPLSAGANGLNGSANGPAVSSTATSRASTPASGMGTPNAMGQRAPMSQSLSLPGLHKDHVRFAPSQLTPRNQLKKPVQDVLRDINRRSKARVEMKQGPQGVIIFEGQGPTDESVRQALKEVATQLGSKQSIKVTVPASVRAHLIGRQGSTIQGISKRTGARIQVPKQDDNASPFEDDDSAIVEVVIEGDAVSAELARREIEAIVNERTSTVNMRLKDVPAEFYPFLAGAHNSRVSDFEQGRDVRVQIPQYYTWAEQAPPSVARGQPIPFVPQASYPIHISGDRQAVQDIQAALMREVETLRRKLVMDQMPIERSRHQFIVGDRGSSIHDFLKETGCSVILPPNSDDSETLYIVGPPDKIENGVNKVMDLADSMRSTNVDISRQHANAPQGAQTHARNLTRYLQQRQAIEELERAHDASIVLPTSLDSSSPWEIFYREGKNGMRARADILSLIAGHPPSRLINMNVDPFFHQHLQQHKAQQIRDELGVALLFPDEIENSPQLLLVYEGPIAAGDYQLPRGAPSADQVKQFDKSLKDAQKLISGLVGGQREIISRDVEAPLKFYEKIRRYIDREQQGLTKTEIPVQSRFGERRPQESRKKNAHGMSLRGPSSAVDDLEAKIRSFIAQEEKDELERGYTISFDYPQKFANILIGKRGDNIKKLRDEFDVDIQVNDGKVELKGPKAKADAAKSHILALAKKLEDEATYILKIKPQFHRDLIGAKGSQVNRLQDRYNVRINFPRSAAAQDDGDDATEGGQSHKNYRAQAQDEVVIRGPKRGADEAREELLNLLQFITDNSYTATVSVAQSQVPSLIGQGGRELDNFRLETGCQIDVPGGRDVDPSGRVEIKLKGKKDQVEKAKKLLEQRAKVFDQTVTRTIEVDKKHHKTLIGAGGSNIRDIVVNAGGPDDRRELARIVRFPKADSSENTIRIEGSEAMVNKIIAAIESQVNARENQVTETIVIAPEKHRMLIGRGGETRRNLESQFTVTLDIPKQTATGTARSQVKLTGTPSAVESAKEHILNLVKEQEGETIDVPRHLHNFVSDNGQIFRRLRNDFKVTVDHGGQQPPAKSQSTSQARRGVNGGSLPLITDDPDAVSEAFSWEVVDNSPAAPSGADEGTIPWILRGSAENVARAKEVIEKALENGGKPSFTGYLILPDPKAYRLVVGPGGSQINSIRKKTGTKVQVPRDQARGEAIEILGTKEGVEEAKDIILELIKGKR